MILNFTHNGNEPSFLGEQTCRPFARYLVLHYDRAMMELGVIADDLTGGMMVASLLEREGVHCPLVTSVAGLQGLPADTEAVVIGRKIRLIAAADASADAQASANSLRALGAQRIFYKYCATFDSTEEGNIGPIAEALMATLETDRTIFCPAFPEYTVTVFQGRMFLSHIMLGESSKRFDPVTPMTNSNLVEVLQAQSKAQVGLISHAVLARGLDEAKAYVDKEVKDGKNLFLVDAVDDTDVTRIAELCLHWPLTTGADALPMFLARAWRDGESATPASHLLPPSQGAEAVIAGSCAQATLDQLDEFSLHHPVFRIDLMASNEAIRKDLSAWITANVVNGPVALATSGDVETVKKAQSKFGVEGAAERADEILGFAAQCLRSAGVKKFVVAGGETSGQVMNALGVQQVQVAPFDNLSGGYCHAPGLGTSFVLKAGALGDRRFFFTALERMREADAQGA